MMCGDDESLEYLIGTGNYSFTPTEKKRGKSKAKKPIGFVDTNNVRNEKHTKDPAPRKRAPKTGGTKKG